METKEVKGNYSEYLNFGWKLQEEQKRRGGRGHHYTVYIIQRDENLKDIDKLKQAESKYFSLKKQKRYYSPVDGAICFMLFLLFIIPGIIYLVVKNNQKHTIESHNAYIDKQMKDILFSLQ